MGATLRKMFGTQMIVFGFAFNQGSFQAVDMPPSKAGLRTFNIDPAPEGSLDALLASAKLQIAAIDLHSAQRSTTCRVPSNPSEARLASCCGVYSTTSQRSSGIDQPVDETRGRRTALVLRGRRRRTGTHPPEGSASIDVPRP